MARKKNAPPYQPKTRNGVPVIIDGQVVYRVRCWDRVAQRQVEKTAYGEDHAIQLAAEFQMAKSVGAKRRLVAERITVATLVDEFLIAYALDRNGDPRPHSTWYKASSILDVRVKNGPLGRRYLDDLSTKDLDDAIRAMVKRDGKPLAPSSRQTVANVLRSMFTWAKYEGKTTINLGAEIHTAWGSMLTHRCLIPSLPQLFRLAAALDHFSPGLGDCAVVLGLVGLRWEELAGMSRELVDLYGQTMVVDRTASESGGRRELRMLRGKSAAAMRTVVIPDEAMPAVRRLFERDERAFMADVLRNPPPARELRQDDDAYLASEAYYEWYLTAPWARLVNNSQGGFVSYGNWRKVLARAQAYTAAHPDGIVCYTAHQLRHVAASLLIASGATDMQVQNQIGHSKVETTKNIYGHLWNEDRAGLLAKLNAKITQLHVVESAAA